MKTSHLLPGLLLAGLGLWACGEKDPGFGGGGSTTIPPEDTGPDAVDDTGDSGDPDDTGAEGDDTAGGDDSGDSGDSDDELTIPGGEDCGYSEGDVACNLTGETGGGEELQLWTLYGDETVVVVGHGYDQQLQSISGWLQGVADKRGAEAVVVLLDAPDTTAADADDAAAWASDYGLDTVLHDADGSVRASGWSGGSTTVTWLMTSDLVIDWIAYGYVGESQLDDKIKDL